MNMLCLAIICSGLVYLGCSSSKKIENDLSMYDKTKVSNRIKLDSAGPKTDKLELKWKWEKDLIGAIFTKFIVNNGKVIFCTATDFKGPLEGAVYCFNITSGEIIWVFNAGADILYEPELLNGKIYFWANAFHGSSPYYCKLFCIDQESGQKVWDYTINKAVNFLSKLAIWNNNVYFFANYEKSGEIICLVADNGRTVWDIRTSILNCQNLLISNNRFIIDSWDKILYCINTENGKVIWESLNDAKSKTSLKLLDGKIYWSNISNVVCLNEDNGKKIWNYKTNSISIVNVSPKGIILRTVKSGKNNSEQLVCLETNSGDLIWEKITKYYENNIITSPSFEISNDNKIFYTSNVNIQNKFNEYKYLFIDGNTGITFWDNISYSFINKQSIIYNNNIFIINGYGSDGFKKQLICLDIKTGAKIWEIYFVSNSNPIITILNDRIYLLASVSTGMIAYSTFYYLNINDGSILYEYYFQRVDSVDSFCYLTIANNNILVGSLGGRVHCFGDKENTNESKTVLNTINDDTNLFIDNRMHDKPESFVFKGAHPPGGCRGDSNDFYYWIWKYGPASTCEEPEFYDVNTGKLLFKDPYTYSSVKVFGKYIALIGRSGFDNNKYLTFIYDNNKLLRSISNKLVYIVNDTYCIEDNNKLIFKNIINDEVLNIHQIENGFIVPENQNIPETIYLISKYSSYLLDTKTYKIVLDVPFDLGYYPKNYIMKISQGVLFELDLQKRFIKVIKEVRIFDEIDEYDYIDNYVILDANKAFDNNKSILYDINTGKQVAFLDNFRYGINRRNIILFTNSYDGKRFYAYSTINGKQLWTYETKGISGALVYGDKLIYVEDETNKTICIDINTGKTIWETNDVYLSYYSTFFNGNDAYDYDYVNVGNGYLIKLDLETGKTLFKKQIEDLSYIDFENDVFYTIQYEKEPKKYQLKDFKRIW